MPCGDDFLTFVSITRLVESHQLWTERLKLSPKNVAFFEGFAHRSPFWCYKLSGILWWVISGHHLFCSAADTSIEEQCYNWKRIPYSTTNWKSLCDSALQNLNSSNNYISFGFAIHKLHPIRIKYCDEIAKMADEFLSFWENSAISFDQYPFSHRRHGFLY